MVHSSFKSAALMLSSLRPGVNMVAIIVLGSAALAHLGKAEEQQAATAEIQSRAIGHKGAVVSVAYAADGKTFATAAWDGTVRLWDAATVKELRQWEIPPKSTDDPRIDPKHMRRVALSPDGKLVAALCADHNLVVWNAQTQKEVYNFTRTTSVAFSPDGKLLAYGEFNPKGFTDFPGIIRTLNLTTGRYLPDLHGHQTSVDSLAFAPDSKTLISCGAVLMGIRAGAPGEMETKYIRLWDLAKGKELPIDVKVSRIRALTVSPDGRMLNDRARFVS
jgi:WD40 repeat protein